MVLLHNTMRSGDMSREQKMHFRWLGPYRVKEAVPLKGTYVLEELNGAKLGGTVAGNRLKKFHPRTEKDPEFAVPASGYGKLPIGTSFDSESWHSDISHSKSLGEGGESFASERGVIAPQGEVRGERFVGVFIPARV
jgi:hypothetical protein